MLSEQENELLTKTGPGTLMGDYFRRFWIPFLTSDELPGPDSPPVRVTLLHEELVAFRETGGRVGLVDAYCAHRGSPLFYARNEECGLRCVYHGWKYDLDGQCVDMPSEPPGSTFKEKVRLAAYPTRESGGVIWAYMGPKEHVPELPDLEWRMVPDSHRYMVKYLVDSNYMQAMEGDDDTSHVSFLHSTLEQGIDSNLLGRNKEIVDYWITGKSPRLFVDETDFGLLTGSQRPAGEEAYYWRITPWLEPGYSLIPNDPGKPILCNVRVPVDDARSLHFRIVAHPYRPLTADELDNYVNGGSFYAETIPGTPFPVANIDNDYLIDREIQKTKTYTGIKGIPTQDRAVTERMRPSRFSRGVVERSQEHLGTSDTTIIKMRRRLLRNARALSEGVEPYPATHPSVYTVRPPAVKLPRDVAFQEGAKDYIMAKKW